MRSTKADWSFFNGGAAGNIYIVKRARKADSTLRSSQAVPHPSTNRALRRLTSEVGRDPVHSTRYGRRRNRRVQQIWRCSAAARQMCVSRLAICFCTTDGHVNASENYRSMEFADGHTESNAPDLLRPPKLSGAGPG